jgi:mannose-1-phosphate guanylyltransferase
LATYAVIIAGGSATRLWPATRKSNPKQFQSLIYDRPLLVETVERISPVVPPERVFVVTSAEHEQMTADLLPAVPRANIIGEPAARNTTAAIGLAAARIMRQDASAIVGFFHADHYVGDPERLQAAIQFGFDLARTRSTVTIGIRPTEPATGYGYIETRGQCGQQSGLTAYDVVRFIEKPDLARAEQFLQQGGFLWNAGLFLWRVTELRGLFDRNLGPEIWQALERVDDGLHNGVKDADSYGQVPSVAIDYAILEKAEDIVVVDTPCGWRDIGDWAALHDALPGDGDGNATSADSVLIDSRNTLIHAPNGKMVAAIGLEEMIVVVTDDAVFVCPKSRAQDVRQIVAELRARGREDLL